jgi:hypothetical protein
MSRGIFAADRILALDFGARTGRADKRVIIAEAKRRFPDRVIMDDNEADALLQLEFARKGGF